MNKLSFWTGIAVLFTTLGYAHLVYHFIWHANRHGAGASMWAGIAFGALAGVFSFIGGCLLIRSSR